MKDIHIVRYFSSRVTISGGKVTKVTDPSVSYCPLAGFFYNGFKDSEKFPVARLKDEIKKVIEDKINRFGFCTKDRMLWKEDPAIPYGASELIAHGLKNNIIDGAVIVCDGAGTVITAVHQIVQGVGARMHTMLKTTHIPDVAIKLRRYGCYPLDDKGRIDQVSGVEEAAKKGYKRIAVTVNANGGDRMGDIRALEGRYGVSSTILAVCTTGIKEDRLNEVEKYADIVWACNSGDIRARLGGKAMRALSNISPVYILTENGAKLAEGYSPGIFGMRKETERSAA